MNIFNMTEPEKLQHIEDKLKEYREHRAKIDERAAALQIPEPYGVIIEKVDFRKLMTVLEIPEEAKKDRIRLSSIARIIKSSDAPTDDPALLHKRNLCKSGRFARINQESAFHLMIDEFFEIWVCHIDNIIVYDEQFDAEKLYEESLKRSLGINQKVNLHIP